MEPLQARHLFEHAALGADSAKETLDFHVFVRRMVGLIVGRMRHHETWLPEHVGENVVRPCAPDVRKYDRLGLVCLAQRIRDDGDGGMVDRRARGGEKMLRWTDLDIRKALLVE